MIRRIMKYYSIGLILIFSLLSCSRDEHDTKILTGQEFAIREGERMDLMDTTQFIAELEVQEITDSRCPVNAQCIRAGEALVTLGIRGNKGGITERELCIGDCTVIFSRTVTSDTVAISVDDISITLILLAVDPYPSLANNDTDKTASFLFESYTITE